MVQVQSKFAPIHINCYEFCHPWTESCLEASVGSYLCAIVDSLRIYTTVYMLALLMKGSVPSKEEIKKTVLGMLQSTAFLSANGMGFTLFLCLLRKLLGHFNFLTVSAIPSFLANFFAILIERPSRRTLLSLYVSNVATETVWNMAVSRDWVRPRDDGVVVIFSVCMAILLTYFKSGLHKRDGERVDSMFGVLRLIVGPYEEKSISRPSEVNTFHREQTRNDPLSSGSRWSVPGGRSSANNTYRLITQALRIYRRLINKIKCLNRNPACPHPFSCVHYTLQGACKMAGVGLSIQLALSFVFNLKSIFLSPRAIKTIVWKKKTLSLAIFLGGFSGLFRGICCVLRNVTGTDSACHAIPAALIAGIAFKQYPDTTVALYVMWKMAQISYGLGIERGIVPRVPGFTIFLYCVSTAILFHTALLEPVNLRPSYWKFLHSISAGRVATMNREPLDVWGLETSRQLVEVLRNTHTRRGVKYYVSNFS
uniref:Transmembrane protein 135 N-terminal domain-containing protein n=1 Tax=Photinus pyralis TaxID=7054 RepID=A0A1Y1MM10_PHOPY